MKINLRLSDCRSLMDLGIYYLFPNTAFKYRQSGPYKVEGVREMVQQIYRNHKGFSIVLNYVIAYALLQLTAYVAIFVVYSKQSIYLPMAALPFLFLSVLWNPITAFVAANGIGCNSYINIVLVSGLVLTAFYQTSLIPIVSLLIAFTLTYVFRQVGWARAFYNDLKNKKSAKYGEFFKRYCRCFREVFSEAYSPTHWHSAISRNSLRAADQTSPEAHGAGK
jgi:hypothetical protein